jgi:hypothetical protein
MAIKAASIQPNDRKRRVIFHHIPTAIPLRARMFEMHYRDGLA